MSLRSQRLARTLDPEAAAFLDSTREDAELALDDVVGSLAHVKVLRSAGIFSNEEAAQLRKALVRLYQEAKRGELKLDPSLEDVHMNVEARLTARLGDLGKKLHTGRSRNDQVALDLRLFARRWALAQATALHALVKSLLALGDAYPDAILPGYTHLQVAQPVLLRFHLLAHAERFLRDLGRVSDAYTRLNVSPLGAGALAGTRHGLEPRIAAEALGFDAPFRHAMDAVSDRDYVAELLFGGALALAHASGLAEELILFTSQEFGFATIGDEFATGSSIMPQKKNPDVFEVTRAKAATALGGLTASLAALKALPLAYNRDLQEQKRLFVDTFPALVKNLHLLARVLERVEFHPKRMARAAERGYGDATDLADYLVRKGVPFRDAHAQVARLVRFAAKKDLPLDALDIATLREVNPKIRADVRKYLGAASSVQGKKSPGGTAPASTKRIRDAVAKDLAQRWRFFEAAAGRVHERLQALTQPKESHRT